MKKRFYPIVVWAISGLCPVLPGCGNAPAETARASAEQAEQRPSLPAASPLTDAERTRLQQALSPRLSRSSRALKESRTSTGSKRIDLQGQFQHMTIATRDLDGHVSQQCVSTPEELNQLLADQQERDRIRSRRRP